MSKMIKLAILIGICVFSIYIICVDGLIYLFGGYDLLRYEYGALFKVPYIVCVFLLILIPIMLIISIIKDKNCFKFIFFVVMYIILALGLIVGVGKLNTYTASKYQNFSYKIWNNKPYVRQIMYKSLVSDKSIYSLNKKEIINKLGTPDEEEDNFLSYKTMPGKIVITFNNNRVDSIKYNLD